MRITIIGCNGQLGYDMVSACQAAGHQVQGFDYPEIDITNLTSTESVLQKSGPEVLINCAAYTAVDACETNRDAAW